MKNSKWVFFFGALFLLILPSLSMAQTVEEAAKTGLFAKIGDWMTSGVFGIVVTFICGFLAKGGYTAIIKKVANKGAVFFTELEHFSGDTAKLCDIVDKSIKDDNTIDQNSIKEVIAAGKEVIVEMKDMKAVFMPKI